MQLFKPHQSSLFRLLAGTESQASHRWTPPGAFRVDSPISLLPSCGIRTPGRGELKAVGGIFYAVQVTFLDDIDPKELAAAPIHYVDGRHDRFDQVPFDVRFL